MDDIIILLYIGLFMLAIISSMMCHAIGKAQGFKDGFETAKRIYKQDMEKTDVIDEFVNAFVERIKYDEVVQYVDLSEFIAVSRGSVICLVKKLAEELNEKEEFHSMKSECAKEHLAMTNEDKFEEVFGFKPSRITCTHMGTLNCRKAVMGLPCDETCENYTWWQQEWKDPKTKGVDNGNK